MGAELSIPKGAVSSRTLITMEDVGAIEGAFWAYEFTPSGLTFKKPAELEVDVSLEFLQANGIDPGRSRPTSHRARDGFGPRKLAIPGWPVSTS
jgi:hypothetical protein